MTGADGNIQKATKLGYVESVTFWRRFLDGGSEELKTPYHWDAKNKLDKLGGGAVAPSTASLLNRNIWENTGEDDFNLEYMDLDEFLMETGLVDANFGNIVDMTMKAPLEPSEQPAQDVHTSQERSGQLDRLESSKSHIPSPAPMAAHHISSPTVAHQLSPLNSADPMIMTACELIGEDLTKKLQDGRLTEPSKQQQQPAKSVPQSESNIVKKRRYSDDGEGLSDTAVVVVPGQDGFDPAQAKFAPEELKPQPIIKKSKKQFVSDDNKDEKYWKRRNKNNVAAKRSREARRAKENQIIMRAGFLENENERLTIENHHLLEENEKLQRLVKQLRSN